MGDDVLPMKSGVGNGVSLKMDDLSPMLDDPPPMLDDPPPITNDHRTVVKKGLLKNGDAPVINGDVLPINSDLLPIAGDVPPIAGDVPPIVGDVPPITGDVQSMMRRPLPELQEKRRIRMDRETYGLISNWYEQNLDVTDRIFRDVDEKWMSSNLELMMKLACEEGHHNLLMDLKNRFGAAKLAEIFNTHPCYLYLTTRGGHVLCVEEIVTITQQGTYFSTDTGDATDDAEPESARITSSRPISFPNRRSSKRRSRPPTIRGLKQMTALDDLENGNAKQEKTEEDVIYLPMTMRQLSHSAPEEQQYYTELLERQRKLLDYKEEVQLCGCNSLNLAVQLGHRDIVEILLEQNMPSVECALQEKESKQGKTKWKTFQGSSELDEPTCLDLLAETMPDLMCSFFDRKIMDATRNNEYDFNLLDRESELLDKNFVRVGSRHMKAMRYHPVIKILQHGDTELCRHGYVTAYVYQKWSEVRVFHFLTLLWYVIYPVITTTYMLTADRHQYGDQMLKQQTLTPQMQDLENSNHFWSPSLCYIMLAFPIIGIMHEVAQMVLLQWLYIDNVQETVQNVMELYMYGMCVWMFGFNSQGYRSSIQWEFAATGVLVSWMVFFLHHPVFSTYLGLAIRNILTLWRFTFMFLLFLLMFGLTFGFLLPNQESHNHPGSSLIRTWTMMLGDISYTDMFYPDEDYAQVQYKTATYIIFFVFLLLALIITNMWTGFIITKLEDMADYMEIRETEVQMNFILTVRLMTPKWLRMSTILTTQSKYPKLCGIQSFLREILGDRCFHTPDLDQVKISSHKRQRSLTDRRIECLTRDIANLKRDFEELKDCNKKLLKLLESKVL